MTINELSCVRGEHKPAVLRPWLWDCDTDILKMYPHSENEPVSLRDSKLRALIEKYDKCLSVNGQGQNVKSSELLRALS